jgi:membrane peptidoglycan carboxypeptidase
MTRKRVLTVPSTSRRRQTYQPHPPRQHDTPSLPFLRPSKTKRQRARTEPGSAHPQRRIGRLLRLVLLGVLLIMGSYASLVFGKALLKELQTSEYQAHYLTELGRQLAFGMAPGQSPASRFPHSGPYDEQLGYTRLPVFFERLTAHHYTIQAQARLSPRLQQLIDWGLFPIYREKTQAGLRIVDGHGAVLHNVQYPERLYATFEEIPPLIVQTLLYIENRELLDPRYPYRNPAVEWDRFGKALLDMAVWMVNKHHHAAGGSTLATQIEKFRHSAAGRTTSPYEKLRQMASASIRAYQDGIETLATQQQIILDYINSIPLAALANYGEVRGLGDGLWAWYNTDLTQVNRVLAEWETAAESSADLEARALLLRQVLSLFVAHRRPSFYLHRPEALAAHTDSYLRLMSRDGLISPTLCDTALQARPIRRQALPLEPRESFLARKATNAVRTKLLTLLDVPSLYDLDRFDLTVRSTLDQPTQEAVTNALQQAGDRAYRDTADLRAGQTPPQGADPAKLLYSFTLYERGSEVNLLRVQTDTIDQPFDINQGVRIDLGSTAKLRTLVSYLEAIARLHQEYVDLSPKTLRTLNPHLYDHLSRWAIQYLASTADKRLHPMLEAAMARPYSASPGEQFFTGGGLHTFENFNREDNGKVMPVRMAFRNSVNLVFIRMMRDIVYYYMYSPEAAAALLEQQDHPQRQEYLKRFADQEGQVFLRRFYRKYAGKSPDDIVNLVVKGPRQQPKRLAALYGAIEPTPSEEAFAALMRTHRKAPLSDQAIESLYMRYVTTTFSLADQGYLTRLHPLELWVVTYLHHHPKARFQEVVKASTEARQEVYQWLLKGHRTQAQNRRIRTLLEEEAFVAIHQSWKRLGYPFDDIVPSYASAIGSSGDRPEALAELMGILVNDGMRYPTSSIQQLHFAAGTPYETRVGLAAGGERVLPAAVAGVVKQALFDVVEQGTAKRAWRLFQRPDGSLLPLGGKTGTGDHRFKRVDRSSRVVESRAVSRAASFVFMIDTRFFGTITAYVSGPEAANYRFTSALAVQMLKLLAATLQPLLNNQTVSWNEDVCVETSLPPSDLPHW